MHPVIRLSACLFSFCLLAVICGCGKQEAPISGTVSFQSKPLNYGRIYFNVDNGKSVASSEIQQDGTFSIPHIDPGEARIAVIVSPPPKPSTDPTAPQVPQLSFVPVVVPDKFGNVETSGVVMTVDPAIRNYTVELK